MRPSVLLQWKSFANLPLHEIQISARQHSHTHIYIHIHTVNTTNFITQIKCFAFDLAQFPYYSYAPLDRLETLDDHLNRGLITVAAANAPQFLLLHTLPGRATSPLPLPLVSLIYVFTHICQQFVRPTNKFIGVLPLFKQRVHCPACPITKSTNSASHLPPPPHSASLACPWSSCASSMSARWHILNILCLLHISPLARDEEGDGDRRLVIVA